MVFIYKKENMLAPDPNTMTQKELEDALEALAASWRRDPPSSNSWPDGLLNTALTEALKDRFGVCKKIVAIDGKTDYQVVPC